MRIKNKEKRMAHALHGQGGREVWDGFLCD